MIWYNGSKVALYTTLYYTIYTPMATFVELFANTQTQIIAILIALDVILGILSAVSKKEFRFGKVAEFMQKPVLAYLFGFGILQLVAQAQPSLSFFVPTAFLLIAIALLASISRNLHRLGLPLPGAERL